MEQRLDTEVVDLGMTLYCRAAGYANEAKNKHHLVHIRDGREGVNLTLDESLDYDASGPAIAPCAGTFHDERRDGIDKLSLRVLSQTARAKDLGTQFAKPMNVLKTSPKFLAVVTRKLVGGINDVLAECVADTFEGNRPAVAGLGDALEYEFGK
jgi:hypothetical protein